MLEDKKMGHFHQKAFDREKEREKSKKAEEEHRLREERFAKEREKKVKKKKIVVAGVVIVLLILVSVLAFYFFTPGKYDNFANCLTEKGAIMYGEDWCQYTNAQKNMFGKSFKYINYQVKTGLGKRPTWVIDGKSYETVQSFERLSALTGCKY